MATPTVKTTYSLDVETVRKLQQIARRWKVSRSEALRRLIRRTATEDSGEAESRLQALDKLQGELGLSTEAAARWEKETLEERRASWRRVGSRPS